MDFYIRLRRTIGISLSLLLITGTTIQAGMSGFAASDLSVTLNPDAQLDLALQKRSTSFTVSMPSDRSPEQALLDAFDRNEYVKYTIADYRYTDYTVNQAQHRIEFQIGYRETAAQSAQVEQYIRNLLPKIVTSQMNDHEKVKAVHDWIVRHIAYDQTQSRFSAYDAIFKKSAVCNGYALLVKIMLDELGIRSRIAEGQAGNQNHAWNLVQLDGNWYHLDATWNDPVPDRPAEVSYEYYLLTEQQIGRDHQWTLEYPVASTRYENILQQKINAGGNDTKRWETLFHQLDLYLLSPAYRATDAAGVREIINRQSDRSKSVRFIFAGNEPLGGIISNALNPIDGWERYAMTYEKYKRGETSGETLVDLNIKWTGISAEKPPVEKPVVGEYDGEVNPIVPDGTDDLTNALPGDPGTSKDGENRSPDEDPGDNSIAPAPVGLISSLDVIEASPEQFYPVRLTMQYDDGSLEDVTAMAQWTADDPAVMWDGNTLGTTAFRKSVITFTFGKFSMNVTLDTSIQRIESNATSLKSSPGKKVSPVIHGYTPDGTRHLLTGAGAYTDEGKPFESSLNWSFSDATHLSATDAATFLVRKAGRSKLTVQYATSRLVFDVDSSLQRLQLGTTGKPLKLTTGKTITIPVHAFYADGTKSDISKQLSLINNKNLRFQSGKLTAKTKGSGKIVFTFLNKSVTLSYTAK